MMVDEKLLAILACPVSKLPLREEEGWLICDGSGLKYPVREGIPVLLIEEARCLDDSVPDAAHLLVRDDSVSVEEPDPVMPDPQMPDDPIPDA